MAKKKKSKPNVKYAFVGTKGKGRSYGFKDGKVTSNPSSSQPVVVEMERESSGEKNPFDVIITNSNKTPVSTMFGPFSSGSQQQVRQQEITERRSLQKQDMIKDRISKMTTRPLKIKEGEKTSTGSIPFFSDYRKDPYQDESNNKVHDDNTVYVFHSNEGKDNWLKKQKDKKKYKVIRRKMSGLFTREKKWVWFVGKKQKALLKVIKNRLFIRKNKWSLLGSVLGAMALIGATNAISEQIKSADKRKKKK